MVQVRSICISALMQFSHAENHLQHAGFECHTDGSVDLGDVMQDGGVLYNFEGSTGLSARLHPAAQAKLSAEDAAIWQSEPRCPASQTAILMHVAFVTTTLFWLQLLPK